MGVLIRSTARRRGRWISVAALAVTLVAAPATAGGGGAPQGPTIAEVKAALLYNFAKFTEWPALPSAGLIVLCVAGDEPVADALATIVGGHDINGHKLEVWRPRDTGTWRLCHVLFIAGRDVESSASVLIALKLLPVLTVSDGTAFSERYGIIELYLANGKFGFAINIDAAERSRLRLSSHLLGLARVVRDSHGH